MTKQNDYSFQNLDVLKGLEITVDDLENSLVGNDWRYEMIKLEPEHFKRTIIFRTLTAKYGMSRIAYSYECSVALEYLESVDIKLLLLIGVELNDERTHGSLPTYNTGCRGELCKNARTLYVRRNKGRSPQSESKELIRDAMIDITKAHRLYQVRTGVKLRNASWETPAHAPDGDQDE